METQTRAEREVSRQGARRAVAAATDKRKDAEVREIRGGGCPKVLTRLVDCLWVRDDSKLVWRYPVQ